MTDNLKNYREIAGNLYSQSIAASGITIEELEKAEKFLGFRLPTVLREFYLMVGNHEAINYSHNRLISVDFLEIENNRLIFYSENQGVCYWAIDLANIAEDNPPVWVGQSIENQDELDWHIAARHLSDFLIIMLCWQSVMGGLPFVGIKSNVEVSVIGMVKNNFSLIEVGEEFSGIQAFIGKGKVVCLGEGKETTIDAGAVDEKNFLEIENLLQIEWDYSTFDE